MKTFVAIVLSLASLPAFAGDKAFIPAGSREVPRLANILGKLGYDVVDRTVDADIVVMAAFEYHRDELYGRYREAVITVSGKHSLSINGGATRPVTFRDRFGSALDELYNRLPRGN